MKKAYIKDFIALILFGLCLWGGEYYSRKLWEPDEARFSYVAREMRQDGHIFVPHKYGETYAHKPPMLFWVTNTVIFFTGDELPQVAGRVSAFLGVILSLWITFRLAEIWFSRRVAFMAILILSSSYAVWHEGAMARMDSLLCGLGMSALYLLFFAKGRYRQQRIIAAYCCMGLAVLTKGPVGLLVPIVAYIAFMLASGEWRNSSQKHLLWGTMIALLFPALWFYGAYQEGASPEYFKELLVKQNLNRFAGLHSFGKPQPFYYYFLRFPLSFLPWSVMLPAVFYAYLRGRRDGLPLQKAAGLLWWALAVILFFSLSKGKREIYILLAFPPVSILLASFWGRLNLHQGKIGHVSGIIVCIIMFLFGCACLSICFIPLVSFLGYRTLPSAFVLIMGSVCILRSIIAHGLCEKTAIAIASVLLISQFFVSNFVYPAFNSMKTPSDEVVLAVQEAVPSMQPLLMFRSTGNEIVPLYCNRKGLTVRTKAQLDDVVRTMGKGAVVFYDSDWQDVGRRISYVHAEIPFKVGNKRLHLGLFDIAIDSNNGNDL